MKKVNKMRLNKHTIILGISSIFLSTTAFADCVSDKNRYGYQYEQRCSDCRENSNGDQVGHYTILSTWKITTGEVKEYQCQQNDPYVVSQSFNCEGTNNRFADFTNQCHKTYTCRQPVEKQVYATYSSVRSQHKGIFKLNKIADEGYWKYQVPNTAGQEYPRGSFNIPNTICPVTYTSSRPEPDRGNVGNR